MDIVSLALNLYTQGIAPGLDFSDISAVARTVEDCNQLPIHPRHPYVGDLVHTAFSGSHQDAIKKGFAAQPADALWEVPYLPVDPADIGRTYESVIRVNSQSGKGGMAFLLERDYGLVMPRRAQIEFSRVVQEVTDSTGKELTSAEIWAIFNAAYLQGETPYAYVSHRMTSEGTGCAMETNLRVNGAPKTLKGSGNGPIDAFVHALGADLKVLSFEEHSMGSGSDAKAVAFVEVQVPNTNQSLFGIGIHPDIVTASLHAVVSAANRSAKR